MNSLTEKTLFERVEEVKQMITKKVVYDAIIAAIIIVVQYLFLKVYRMGSDILIEMMNIKYN